MYKPIERDRLFEKHFRSRVARNSKLMNQSAERYTLFSSGVRDYPLNDHQLTGAKKGMRAFSITANIRVVYREEADRLLFLDIGAHNQVY